MPALLEKVLTVGNPNANGTPPSGLPAPSTRLSVATTTPPLVPLATKLNEFVPVAGKRQFEDDADHAVVVVLDVTLQTLAALEDEGIESLFDGGALVTDVSGSKVFETGIDGAGAEDLPKLVEANLFADVELDQDQHGSTQGGVRRLNRHKGRQGLGRHFANGRYRDCSFEIHTATRNSGSRLFRPETRASTLIVPEEWQSGERRRLAWSYKTR